MGIQTVTVTEYKCDHCGYPVHENPLKKHSKSAKVTLDVGYEYQGYGGTYWLCGDCTDHIAEYLGGK